MSKNMINYWLAGAHFTEGTHDDSEFFFKNGVWEMRFTARDATPDRDHYFSLYTNIRSDDRIALKLAHHHSEELEIRALGIVQDNPHSNIGDECLVLYVKWILHALNRRVAAEEHYQRLHGPISESAWRDRIFSL